MRKHDRRPLDAASLRLRNRLLRPWFGAVTGIRTSENVAAITFDDGPNPLVTPRILAMFERHGAKATHFMIGDLAQRLPDLVGETLGHGHVVAGHSFDHPSLVRLDAGQRKDQIERGQRALGDGAAPFFRPPYGHFDLPTARSIRAAGLTAVTWTRHCLDWEAHDAAFFAQRLRSVLTPGAIILLHEGLYSTELGDEVNDRGPVLDALEEVLAASAGRWSFVTVPELLRRGPPIRSLRAKLGSDDVMAAQRHGQVWYLARDSSAGDGDARHGENSRASRGTGGSGTTASTVR